MPFQGTFEKSCILTARAPTELSFFTASLSIFLTITNIPCNLLIILAVVVNPNKNLRSPFNWLIANLAAADLIVGAVIDPLSIYVHMKEGLDIKIRMEEVKTIHLTYFIACTASVLSLTFLAVERFLAIQKPYSYRSKFTDKRIFLTVSGIWLFSVTLPQVYFQVGYMTYSFIFVNTSIVVAIVITCFVYSLFLSKVKLRVKDATNHDQSNGNDDSVARHPPDTAPSSVPNRALHANSVLKSACLMEAKVTKMFTVVLIVMLCCYGPSTIMIYVMNFCESCSCSTLHWLRDLQFIFVIMNSNLTFYCYALKSPRLRSAFVTILKRRRQRAEENHSYINRVRHSISSSAGQSVVRVRVTQWSREIVTSHSNPGLQNKETAM